MGEPGRRGEKSLSILLLPGSNVLRVTKRAIIHALAAVIGTAGVARGDETLRFNTRDPGLVREIRHWGIDLTWASPKNTRESVANAGPEIDFVRIGFYMHEPLTDEGELSAGQVKKLKHALHCARMVGEKVPVMMTPHNEEGIIDWYKNPDGSVRMDRWLGAMEKTRDWIISQGHRFVIVEAFNEPDFKKWNMGTRKDLEDLNKRLESWKVIRVGPSTMNSRWAKSWYEAARDNLDAGSTHTLYGTMRQFVEFGKHVRDGRRKFFCPESHSIAEAMAGAEAGVEFVAWWAAINPARGNFMRACQGRRLAYAAVEENWSAACVYRAPDGSLHGFVGSTERENGKATTYRFVCGDRDVTYRPDGDRERGAFRKRGEGFTITAKPEGGPISRWIEIVPE